MRLNNLMKPHLLQHRHFLYIPVSRVEDVRGFRAAFEYSPVLCRDVLVAEPPPPPPHDPLREGQGQQQLEGKAGGQPTTAAIRPVTFNRMLLREMQAHVRRLLGLEGGRAGGGGGGDGGGGAVQLHLHLQARPPPTVDISSAKFYLREAEGCAERAARLFVEDHRWEQRHAARDTRGGGDGESDGDGSQSGESDVEDEGSEPEDAVLVRRMAAWGRVQGRPGGGRGRRLLRLLVGLVCCGGGGGGGCCGGVDGGGRGASTRRRGRRGRGSSR